MTFTLAQIIVLVPLAALNLLAFLIMLSDKIRAAEPGAERTSEGMLFFLAAIFGSLGVLASMFAFRHKTRKWYFLIGIPLLVLENAATAYMVYLLIQANL